MIDILIPVLGRPHNAQPLVDSIKQNTSCPHRIVFLCTPTDHQQIEACRATLMETWVMDWPAGRADYARKINWGTRHTGREFLFMCADDVRFEPNWDTAALKAAGNKAAVVGTNDLANKQVQRGEFGTHCLIRRSYIEQQGGTADGQPGTVLHEGYDHNFVDRELCHVAASRSLYVYARHARVKHYHPLWRTTPNDATYKKALKHFRDDQKLFWSRAHLWGYVGLSDHERKLAA